MITIHSSSLYFQPSANATTGQSVTAAARATSNQANDEGKSAATNLPTQEQIRQALEQSGVETGNNGNTLANSRISKALASYNHNRNQPAQSEFHSLIPEIDLYA